MEASFLKSIYKNLKLMIIKLKESSNFIIHIAIDSATLQSFIFELIKIFSKTKCTL